MSRVLAALALVIVLSSSVVLWERHAVEHTNRQVALFMDGTELLYRSRLTGLDLQAYLHELKAAGLYGVASHVSPLRDLVPLGDVDMRAAGTDAAAYARELGLRLPTPTQSILHVKRPELLERLTELVNTLSVGMEVTLFGSVIYTEIPYERLRRASLGFPEDLVAAIDRAGLAYLPVFSPYTGSSVKDFAAYLDTREFAGVMFTGDRLAESLLGVEELKEVIDRKNLPIYWLQRSDTLRSYVPLQGVEGILSQESRIVRGYRISRDETNNPEVNPDNMTARWLGSIKEYNVRAIYMRPFFREPDIGYNADYVAKLAAAVKRAGYTLGPADGFRRYYPHPLLLAAIGIGIGLLCYALALASKVPRVLALMGLAGLVLAQAALFTGLGIYLRLGLGLVGSIAASFAAIVFFSRDKCPWRSFAAVNIATVALALGVASYMSDYDFIAEFQYFRGVKLQYTAPLVLLAALLFIPRFRTLPREVFDEVKRIGLWRTLIILFIGAAAFFIYIRRSGHVHAVSQWELQLRFWLDDVLVARPRFKELLAHPVLLLALYYRKQISPLVYESALVVAATGQVSIVNTFMHLRTPLAISLLRVFHGLWLGTLFGVVAILLVHLLIKAYSLLPGRFRGR